MDALESSRNTKTFLSASSTAAACYDFNPFLMQNPISPIVMDRSPPSRSFFHNISVAQSPCARSLRSDYNDLELQVSAHNANLTEHHLDYDYFYDYCDYNSPTYGFKPLKFKRDERDLLNESIKFIDDDSSSDFTEEYSIEVSPLVEMEQSVANSSQSILSMLKSPVVSGAGSQQSMSQSCIFERSIKISPIPNDMSDINCGNLTDFSQDYSMSSQSD